MTRPAKLVVVALAFLLAACGDAMQSAAAIVDGEKITDAEVRRQLDLALSEPDAELQFGSGEVREQRMKDATRLTLAILIQQELVRAFAEERGIEVDDQELDQAVAETVEQSGGQEAFEQALEERGLSIGDVRENLQRRLLIQDVAGTVTSEQLSEAELRAEYEERIVEFTELHLSHILVRDEGEAEAIRARANPNNFARLARQESIDEESARDGGDLGRRIAVELPEPLARAAAETPVGTVGGPVQSEAGFHVFLVHDRRELPFEQVREQLVTERQGEVFGRWLAERVADADIKVNPRYGRLDVRTGRIVPIESTSTASPAVQLTP